MLKINLENIYRSLPGSSEQFDLEGIINLPDNLGVESAVTTTSVHVAKLQDHLHISLDCKFNIPTSCDRCQDKFDLKTRSEFDHDIPNDQVIHLKHFIFDTSSLLTESLILTIPISKLCKFNCKGLCQRCGANINKTKCPCKIPKTDNNPFNVLKQGKNGTTKEKDI